MKYRIYSTSEKAWKGMLTAIDEAKESVYMEMYILEDDSQGAEFFVAMEAAAERGVKVITLLDVVGSYNILSNSVARLREKGGEVIFCSFFWKRLHRKVLIVDEKVA